MANYIELLNAGKVGEEDVDDFVVKWHERNTGKPLYEFLGMDPDEFHLWVMHPESLGIIADMHKDAFLEGAHG